MNLGSRRGIVGFMLTVALGVAVGAATLVVGKEVAKNISGKEPSGEKKTQVRPVSPVPAQVVQTNRAEQKLIKAQSAYYRSLMSQSGDLTQQLKSLKEARTEYEQFLRKSRVGGKTVGAAEASQALPIANTVGNPFEDGSFVVSPSSVSNTGSGADNKQEPLPRIPGPLQSR